MFKKIALGVLATGLIGVLVIGAVNRTNATSTEDSASRRGRTTEVASLQETQPEHLYSSQGQGRGRGQEATPQTSQAQQAPQGLGGGQGRGGSGQGGRGQGAGVQAQPATGVTGQGGQGKGSDYGQQPEATVQDWRLVSGTIVDVASDLVSVETASGEVIPVEGRPLQYIMEQGYVPQVGSQVTLAGFDEDGEFKIGEYTDHTSETVIVVRDQGGRPMWSGRGQRG
jgi:hypothetical protein